MKYGKPFHSRVNWRAFWRHRWLILNILNQVAYGKEVDAVQVARLYGGCPQVGRDLYRAACEIIEVRR